jgi:hypothetical protein
LSSTEDSLLHTSEDAGGPDRREESARHALEAYRERRRNRRGDDTFFGSDALVLDPAGDTRSTGAETQRRRVEIMEDAAAVGMPEELAALLYDVALEEGLEPALGFELVRTGLGMAPPPDGLSNAPDQPAVDKYLPSWMFPPEPTERLLRERMLRVSFRRLRTILREEPDPEVALRRFAGEPDVGHYGY